MISSGEPSFEPSPSLISSDFQRKLSAPSLRSSVPVVNKEVLTSSASNIGPKLPPHLIKPSSSNQESTSTQSSDFLTRLDTLVTNQVARAKANSELQATIISAQLALPAPPIPNKELVKTSAVFRETIGLTRVLLIYLLTLVNLTRKLKCRHPNPSMILLLIG
jgi:hypothetical protein